VIWQVVLPCLSAMVGSLLGRLAVLALDARRSPLKPLSARQERRMHAALDRIDREIKETR
jgi:hypothetical protein